MISGIIIGEEIKEDEEYGKAEESDELMNIVIWYCIIFMIYKSHTGKKIILHANCILASKVNFNKWAQDDAYSKILRLDSHQKGIRCMYTYCCFYFNCSVVVFQWCGASMFQYVVSTIPYKITLNMHMYCAYTV